MWGRYSLVSICRRGRQRGSTIRLPPGRQLFQQRIGIRLRSHRAVEQNGFRRRHFLQHRKRSVSFRSLAMSAALVRRRSCPFSSSRSRCFCSVLVVDFIFHLPHGLLPFEDLNQLQGEVKDRPGTLTGDEAAIYDTLLPF